MSTDWNKLVNQHLLNISPYVPGKPISEVQREFGLTDVHKLASNENIMGPSPLALEAVARSAAGINYYPDGGCYYLAEALAAKHGVAPEQIVIGNGTDEIIRLVCNVLLNPEAEVIFGHPSFVMYTISSNVMGARVKAVPLRDTYTIDLRAISAAVTDRTRVIFIANPNNPTGTIVRKKEADEFVRSLPDGVLAVFYEANIEYVEDKEYPDSLGYMKAGAPVATMRTFSKVYGLAGLRVGYGILPLPIAAVMHRVRTPFNVNQLAQDAALAALGDSKHLAAAVKFNSDGKKYLCSRFERLGLPYAPSDANFILVDVKRDSQEVFNSLLKKGVIVRPGKFLGFPTHIRVSISSREGNEAFIRALEELLAGG